MNFPLPPRVDECQTARGGRDGRRSLQCRRESAAPRWIGRVRCPWVSVCMPTCCTFTREIRPVRHGAQNLLKIPHWVPWIVDTCTTAATIDKEISMLLERIYDEDLAQAGYFIGCQT